MRPALHWPFAVTAFDVAHKGGRTFGYRAEDASGSMVYLPDHAPIRGVSDEARALIAGVDVLVHDAQYLESEHADADAYGHATVDQAIALATESDVGALVLFHHAPARTDDELEELAKSLVAPMPVTVARQNMAIQVG
jgi:ribonuclease BN (tRNA processing enzyme)